MAERPHPHLMQWRGSILLLGSVACVATLALLQLPWWSVGPPGSTVAASAQDGDLVRAAVNVTDADGAPIDLRATADYYAGASNGTLHGLGAALLDARPGQTLNVTLSGADAYGAYDWGAVYNLTRVRTTPVESQVDRYRLERQLGRAVRVGETIDGLWPILVENVTSASVTLRAEPTLNATVARSPYWPTRVVGVNDTTIVTREEPTLGQSVVVQGDEDEGTAPRTGQVSALNETTIVVDFNAAHAGETVHVSARVLSISPGAGTMALVARAEALDCQAHHRGFVAFQATTDVAPMQNGTTWVNVTIVDPWHHDINAGTVRIGNESRALPALRPGARTVLSFLEPNGTILPVSLNANAHFSHGGGIPDDARYDGAGKANTSMRLAAAQIASSAAPRPTTLGRWTGWLGLGLLLLPAAGGYLLRYRRVNGLKGRLLWPAWMDLHTAPAFASMVLSILHAALLMTDALRGSTQTGMLAAYGAMIALALLGASGLAMARWAPLRWQRARGYHAWLTIAVLAAGLAHAILQGDTFKALRAG